MKRKSKYIGIVFYGILLLVSFLGICSNIYAIVDLIQYKVSNAISYITEIIFLIGNVLVLVIAIFGLANVALNLTKDTYTQKHVSFLGISMAGINLIYRIVVFFYFIVNDYKSNFQEGLLFLICCGAFVLAILALSTYSKKNHSMFMIISLALLITCNVDGGAGVVLTFIYIFKKLGLVCGIIYVIFANVDALNDNNENTLKDNNENNDLTL